MSTYRYSQSPIVNEVAFKETGNGALRAYLYARDDMGSDKLQEVIGGLKQAGLECIPYSFGGKPTLEVRGFKRETQLIQTLCDKHYVDGVPQVEKAKEDKISWLDKLKKRSLQASGLAMMVADVGFIIYGMKEAENHRHVSPTHKRDFSEALAGLCYLAGSSTLGAYGRNDQSQIQLREMAETIIKNAKERGFDVPEDSAVAHLGRERQEGTLTKLNKLFQKYPSEIGNMFYFGAGAFIAQSAMRNRVLKPLPDGKLDWGGVGDTALGSTTMLAGLIATFVKEKATDPDKDKDPKVQSTLEWVKKHPLSMAGALYIGSTVCHAFTTYYDTKRSRDIVKTMGTATHEGRIANFKLGAIPWRILFVGATLVGEVLLSISSKGHGEGVVSDHSVDNSMVAMAADLIAKQPEHRQEQLIDYMAGFFGRSDVLAMKDEDACKLLRQEVEALRKNPWAHANQAHLQSLPPPEKQQDDPSDKPGKARYDNDKPVAAWQARVSKESPSVQPHTSI